MHKLYIQNRFKVLNVNTLIIQNDTFYLRWCYMQLIDL